VARNPRIGDDQVGGVQVDLIDRRVNTDASPEEAHERRVGVVLGPHHCVAEIAKDLAAVRARDPRRQINDDGHSLAARPLRDRRHSGGYRLSKSFTAPVSPLSIASWVDISPSRSTLRSGREYD